MHFPTLAQAVVLISIPCVLGATPTQNDPAFKKAALDQHNADRKKHGVPNLVWSTTLADYARKAATNCAFEHSGGPYGENLHGLSTTGNSNTIDLIAQTKKAIHSGWYGEISKYDWNKPGFSSATGHFTQVVWKGSKKLGCAWNKNGCKRNGMNFYKLVCEYDPPGNYQGQFPANVPKKVAARLAEGFDDDDQQIIDGIPEGEEFEYIYEPDGFSEEVIEVSEVEEVD